MAWKLVPKDCPPLYAKLLSSHARRGAFAGRHVWVTQQSDAEFFPAGRFPLQAGASNGIADWTRQASSISEVASLPSQMLLEVHWAADRNK